MNTINKTGVSTKGKGDPLTAADINAINGTTNACVDAVNYLLKSVCDINQETGQYEREYTINQAILAVPTGRRRLGLKIRFLTEGRKYTEYSFIGSSTSDESWYNAGNWSIEINILDGGEW